MVSCIFQEPRESVYEHINCELKDVKLIIIDEYAMMGKYTLYRIDMNLRKAFDSDLPFGGKSVMLFGDPH